ncbi:MAG: transporter substrate-binding domain-containing protein [Pseudomonadota bacterium]
MRRWIALAAALLVSASACAAPLRVSFNTDKPPFAFKDGSGKVVGIEVDVMREALGRLGHSVVPVQGSKAHLILMLTAAQVEVAATVQGQDGEGVYYSDRAIEFSNVAVSRKSEDVHLATLADLDNYRFVIWQGGWADLGPVFKAKYQPDAQGRFPPNYYQSGTQDVQSRVFWGKRVQVIVIDKTIFEWYRSRLGEGLRGDEEVVYHPIFKGVTDFSAAFRDRALRDAFNGALKAMRADGSYRRILERYR